jgi:hypothetical protein
MLVSLAGRNTPWRRESRPKAKPPAPQSLPLLGRPGAGQEGPPRPESAGEPRPRPRGRFGRVALWGPVAPGARPKRHRQEIGHNVTGRVRVYCPAKSKPRFRWDQWRMVLPSPFIPDTSVSGSAYSLLATLSGAAATPLLDVFARDCASSPADSHRKIVYNAACDPCALSFRSCHIPKVRTRSISHAWVMYALHPPGPILEVIAPSNFRSTRKTLRIGE